MADGVLDEVCDQAFQQGAITPDRRLPKLQGQLDVAGGCGEAADHVAGELGKVDLCAGEQAALAAGEGEEAIDGALALLGRVEDAAGEVAFRLGGVRVVQLDLRLGAQDREGRPQLVGDVRGEGSLARERLLKGFEQRVQGVSELLQLVVRAIQGDSMVEVCFGRGAGRLGDALDGPEHTAGDDPAEQDRHERGDPEGESGLDELLAKGVVDGVVGSLVVDILDELEEGASIPGHELPQAPARWQPVAKGVLDCSLGVEALLLVKVVAIERVAIEEVRDRDEDHPGHEEERPVEEREPDADGGAGQSHGSIR